MTLTPRRYHCSAFVAGTEPLTVVEALVTNVPAGESVLVYENAGTWHCALGVLAEVRVDRGGVRQLDSDGREVRSWSGNPFRALPLALSNLDIVGWRAYGWTAFELAYLGVGQADNAPEGTLAQLVIPRTEVTAAVSGTTIRSVAQQEPASIRKLLESAAATPRTRPEPVDPRGHGGQRYRDIVAAAVEEIRLTDLQKVILSREVPVDYEVDLLATYLLGRRNNEPARSFLVETAELSAAGFSPETIVEVTGGGRVTSQPLAGTRAKTGDPEQDLRLSRELLTEPKEIHEHAISVKAVHDELAEVCRAGSTAVRDFMTIKQRGTVQHLGSQVTGTLRHECGPWDAFAAVFPGITATGIPKPDAYRTIRRHEESPRRLYSGAFLTVSEDGEMDAALVLRSLFQQHGKTWLRAGAGIVSQSQPSREFEETCEKLAGVAAHVVPRDPRPDSSR